MSAWKVPGYTELKPLGQGGFGSVMLARHDATGTAVAIKYLLPRLRQDPDFSALFRAEAEALGALDDPYVVRLYEYVESAAGAAIVMELVDGVTLWDMIAKNGRTTPESALVVLYGSLLGLAAAHARGVVHRDFKPRNVLVAPSGVSKLTDFGIAARAGAPTVPSGSVAYAPPEQFDGGPASPASDVYAATATFYECLAGRPPFTGTTVEAVIWQHHSAEVAMDPVPASLQPIVARGLAKDPRYRPADAAALAAELRATAISAYGPDWEQRGRSHLGEAAVLLAALWPSAGVPALHVTSAEQVALSHGAQHGAGAQAGHGAQAARQPMTRAGLHRWHLRHVLHREHLAHVRASGTRTAARSAGHLHTAVVAVTAAAVIAAGLTVEATGRPPGGPGTVAQPEVAAYAAPLASASPATGSSGAVTATFVARIDPAGDAYVMYAPANLGLTVPAFLSGTVGAAVSGEVARLYAQQFPFTSAPAPVQSLTLNAVGGVASYDFRVIPTLATRYQVKLTRSATAATPLAASAVKTLYVVDYNRYFYNPDSDPVNVGLCPAGQAGCTATYPATIYAPPAALQAEMSTRLYLYGPAGTSLQLDAGATFSAAQRVGADAFEVVASPSQTGAGTIRICLKDDEARDGIGLPGPSVCGSPSIPETANYDWEL